MIQRRSEGIDVALRTRARILNLLERRIARRVPKDAGAGYRARRIRRLGLGQPKVEQNYLAGRSNFQIVGFDIAMNNLPFVRVQVDECVKQLIGPGDHGVSRQRPGLLSEYCRQVRAGDKLHDEERAVALSKVITNSRQDRMIEPGHQSRFMLKLFPLLFVIRQGLLQRHGVAEAKIDCFIDRAHSAHAKLSNQAIAAL